MNTTAPCNAPAGSSRCRCHRPAGHPGPHYCSHGCEWQTDPIRGVQPDPHAAKLVSDVAAVYDYFTDDELEQSARRPDRRYHHAICQRCGQTYQLIDWRGAGHALTCGPNPTYPPTTLEGDPLP